MKFYPFKDDNPLDGILFNEAGSFNINSTGDRESEERINNLWNKDATSFSCLKEIKYPYFMFDFKGNTIKIEKYSIQTYKTDNANKHYCKTWVLSGYDGNKWRNISTILESNLNGPSMIGSFDTDIEGPFTHIKITQIGKPYLFGGTEEFFCLGDIEFFGSFGKHSLRPLTCKNFDVPSPLNALALFTLIAQ